MSGEKTNGGPAGQDRGGGSVAGDGATPRNVSHAMRFPIRLLKYGREMRIDQGAPICTHERLQSAQGAASPEQAPSGPAPPAHLPRNCRGRLTRAETSGAGSKFLLSPLQFGGKRPGEGGRPRTQFDAGRRANGAGGPSRQHIPHAPCGFARLADVLRLMQSAGPADDRRHRPPAQFLESDLISRPTRGVAR